MGRDRKKSNSNNDLEGNASPKKSIAKGGKNGEHNEEVKASAKSKAKTKNGPSPLPDEEYATPSSSPDSAEMDENIEGIKNWPKEDDLELFQQMKKVLPKDDTMKYDSRLNYVDWARVEFKNYSADECKQRWIFVSGHLRHYRILSEVLDDAAKWTNHPWANFNKGSKNNLRHPDLPKKPLTSYMLFYMDMKDQVGKQNPGKGMTDISKVIAELFRNLDAKKKAKYVEKAEKAKEQYQAKMEKFMQEHPDYDILKPKTKVEPPKPPTPFSLFTAQRRDELIKKDKKSKSEALEICRDEYKEMPDDTKVQWILKAKELEPKYLADLEKFKIEHPDLPEPAKKPVLTKEEMALKDKHQGLPDKPPNSGYSLFSRRMLSSDQLKPFETKDRMMQCSLLWKELSDKEKANYNKEAEDLNARYKTDFAAYIEKLPPALRDEALAAAKTGVKRPTVKTEVVGKKLKMDEAAEGVSEDSSNTDSDADDFEAPKKIQKPNSSLQMFCDSNSAKYAKKNPAMTKQELSRLMAKDFAKLSVDKKKVYDNMAQKSKKESEEAKGSSKSPSSKKAALAKPSVVRKPANGSPSKSAVSPPSSPLKTKPSLNATAKPSPKTTASKHAAKAKENAEGPPPSWAIGQNLFKGEPAKPPKEVAAYYAVTSSKKPTDSLTLEELNSRWKKLAKAKKERVIAEHNQLLSEFNANFESFIRNLTPEQLKQYRRHNKMRESGFQDGNSEEEDNGNENAEECDEEQSIVSNESDDGEDEEGEEGSVADEEEVQEVDDNEDSDSEEDSGSSDEE